MGDPKETRVCYACGQEFPNTKDYFYVSKVYNGKEYLRTICKSCSSEEARAWYASNKQRARKNQDKWRKSLPETNPALLEKMRAAQREYGRKMRAENPEQYEKQKAAVRKWNAAHAEKRAEYIRAYYAVPEHREAAKQRAHKRKQMINDLPSTLTIDEWYEIKSKFHNVCAYCGATGPLEQEHVLPVNRGGGYSKENIVPACRKCNRSKRDKDFLFWFRSQKFHTATREAAVLEHADEYRAWLRNKEATP